MKEHIRVTEWIDGENGEGWFNSYYDNDGQPVEGFFDGEARMMLTGFCGYGWDGKRRTGCRNL